MDYAARLRRLESQLPEAKVDALLVSALCNIHYLTGFTGSNGFLLVAPGEVILITDPRYKIQARQETTCKVITARGQLTSSVLSLIRRKRYKTIGFEKSRLVYDSFDTISKDLPLGTSLTPAAGLVEKLRSIKSAEEIALIRRAVQTNSEAFERSLKRAKPGVREFEVAAEIDNQMRRLGAESTAFDTIVASGARSALPHARPTSNFLTLNELVLIDMGARRDGYTSDMTRVLFLGTPPRRVRQLYRSVLDAQAAGIAAVRAGAKAIDVDRAARRSLEPAGLDKLFVHSTGHGLGLEIHEYPRIGRREKTRLEAGMVITIEPGVYMEGFGGIRIEDTVLVTETGCEVLTPTPKELFTL